MAVSVTDPIARAWDRMARVCFKPFDIAKWFTLGFTAWLATLASGGFNVSFNWGGPMPSPSGMIDWLRDHLPLVASVGGGLLGVALALSALLAWLHSRGLFMFIDNLAHDRARVVAPWRQFRTEGNRLFGLRMLLILAAGASGLALLVAAGAIAWPDLTQDRFSVRGGTALLLLFGLGLPLGLGYVLAGLLLDDLVAPVMYVRQAGAREACGIAWREALKPHAGPVILFYLMRLLLSLAAGTIGTLVVCATLCIAALPYLGTVIMLPVPVFMRCYPLYFVEQLGPGWRVFAAAENEPPTCPACGYDLRGNPEAATCPECGYALRAVPSQ